MIEVLYLKLVEYRECRFLIVNPNFIFHAEQNNVFLKEEYRTVPSHYFQVHYDIPVTSTGSHDYFCFSHS